MAWSLAKRVAFRFMATVTFLLVFPFPVGFLPGTVRARDIVESWWDPVVAWVAEAILHIDAPARVFTGSGDTLWHYVRLLALVGIAALFTIAWSVIDRRRLHYARLAEWLWVLVRYYLAAMMFIYGFAKIFRMQFPPIWLGRYDMTLGEMSPMGLLWTFTSHSAAYTIFAGVAEVVGGVLLFSRKTTVFGAFVIAAVMTNVVLLNFCYDVPVKLFSTQLLLMSIGLAAPHARRIITALLGRPTPGTSPRRLASRRVERVRRVAKIVMIASILGIGAHWYQFSLTRPQPTALHGAWRVDRFALDGVDVPPLFTDDTRWRTLIVHEYGATVRLATDRRMNYRAIVDEHTLTLDLGVIKRVFRYTRTPDKLVLDGTLGGKAAHVELSLLPPPPLTTRGFHWVSEHPYNR